MSNLWRMKQNAAVKGSAVVLTTLTIPEVDKGPLTLIKDVYVRGWVTVICVLGMNLKPKLKENCRPKGPWLCVIVSVLANNGKKITFVGRFAGSNFTRFSWSKGICVMRRKLNTIEVKI